MAKAVRRRSKVGGRGGNRRAASSRGRIRRWAGAVAVLVFAVLVFVAGLMLDTTAVLRLTFGWVHRMWVRAPLETSLGAVAVIAAAFVLFVGRGAETPAPRNGRTEAEEPKRCATGNPAPLGRRRTASGCGGKAEQEADADASVDVAPGKQVNRQSPSRPTPDPLQLDRTNAALPNCARAGSHPMTQDKPDAAPAVRQDQPVVFLQSDIFSAAAACCNTGSGRSGACMKPRAQFRYSATAMCWWWVADRPARRRR